MSTDYTDEFVVGEVYGTRDPRNQLLGDSDVAFRVQEISEQNNTLSVEYIVLNGTRILQKRDPDVLPLDEYQEHLTNTNSPLAYIQY